MRKLLQNSLFAAMTAWALYAIQAHADTPALAMDETPASLHMLQAQR